MARTPTASQLAVNPRLARGLGAPAPRDDPRDLPDTRGMYPTQLPDSGPNGPITSRGPLGDSGPFVPITSRGPLGDGLPIPGERTVVPSPPPRNDLFQPTLPWAPPRAPTDRGAYGRIAGNSVPATPNANPYVPLTGSNLSASPPLSTPQFPVSEPPPPPPTTTPPPPATNTYVPRAVDFLGPPPATNTYVPPPPATNLPPPHLATNAYAPQTDLKSTIPGSTMANALRTPTSYGQAPVRQAANPLAARRQMGRALRGY